MDLVYHFLCEFVEGSFHSHIYCCAVALGRCMNVKIIFDPIGLGDESLQRRVDTHIYWRLVLPIPLPTLLGNSSHCGKSESSFHLACDVVPPKHRQKIQSREVSESQSLKKGPFIRRSDNFRDNDTKSKIGISYFSEKANLQALKFDEIAKVDVPIQGGGILQ